MLYALTPREERPVRVWDSPADGMLALPTNPERPKALILYPAVPQGESLEPPVQVLLRNSL